MGAAAALALPLLLTVAALAQPQGPAQTGLSAKCPPGMETVHLGPVTVPTEELPSVSTGRNARSPAYFALPAKLNGTITAAANGTWAAQPDGSRSWGLCLQADAETHSLTLIFSALRVPLNSELLIYAPGSGVEFTCSSGCQRLTAFDGSAAGSFAAAPLPGNALVLAYRQPPEAEAGAVIEVGAVLQGIIPLPTPREALKQAASGQLPLAEPPTLAADKGSTNLSAALAGSLDQSADQDSAPKANLSDTLAVAVDGQSGAALPCLFDASCAPQWQNVADAVVLLLLASPQGGRFCTGTLINAPAANVTAAPAVAAAAGSGNAPATAAPPAPATQYIVTANHCRGQDDALTIATLWGVVFSHTETCSGSENSTDTAQAVASFSGSGTARGDGTGGARRGSSGSGSSSGSDSITARAFTKDRPPVPVAPYQVMQGLQLVWANEISDVMLLQLSNEIPEAFTPYFLGWDASALRNDPRGSLTVHHSAGDVKKVTQTSALLEAVKWKAKYPTHLLATWTQGITQTGSSGAALVDAESGLALGVLTGGGLSNTCSGGKDMFGTFFAAWDLGLWKFLSPAGPDAQQSMPGRPYVPDGPGLIVTPSRLLIRQAPQVKRVLQVRLSDPPNPDEVVTVGIAATQSAAQPTRAPLTVIDQQLKFNASNWNSSQLVEVVPGADPLPAALPFQLTLDLSSSTRPGLLKRRTVPGLRTNEGTPEGITPDQATTIPGGPAGIRAQEAGSLQAAAGGQGSHIVKLGEPLAAPETLGTAAFYNLTTAQSVIVGVAACSGEAPLQVAIYNDSIAAWVSTVDCASDGNPDCKAMDDRQQCSGFLRLQLLGTGANPPYTIAVTTKDGSAARFTLQVAQVSREGLLFDPSTRAAG